MEPPLRVSVTRGAIVESEHLVDVAAVRGGETVFLAGRTDAVCMRSAAKPFQALPLARARADLDERDLAIASASHRAEPGQLDAVRALLAKAPATEEELLCGSQPGRPPGPLHHNCSGKHAGMLAACRARGWPTGTYLEAEHPLQQEVIAALRQATGAGDVPLATDGCGVPTFGLTLVQMASAFARFERLEGARRVADAMRTHPELVGGAGAIDTELMRAFPGLLAKGGAEGLLCLVTPGGVSVALKSRDGSPRPQNAALGAVFERLGLGPLPPEMVAERHVRNSRNEIVGSLSGD